MKNLLLLLLICVAAVKSDAQQFPIGSGTDTINVPNLRINQMGSSDTTRVIGVNAQGVAVWRVPLAWRDTVTNIATKADVAGATSAITASNGLTKVGNDIRLGGSMTQAMTTIALGPRAIEFTGTTTGSELAMLFSDGGNNAAFAIHGDGIGMQSTGTSQSVSFDMANGIPTLNLNSTQFTIGGNVAEYAADYSGLYDNRSLVDKEYVDNAVGGVSIPWEDVMTNGNTTSISPLPATDNAVNLGSTDYRWGSAWIYNRLYLGSGGDENFMSWVNGIGPSFQNDNAGEKVIFDLDGLSGVTTVKVRTTSGTMAYLSDLAAAQNLQQVTDLDSVTDHEIFIKRLRFQGSTNIRIGDSSLYRLTTGFGNFAGGVGAAQYLKSGNYRVDLGFGAGKYDSSGNGNHVRIGYLAGWKTNFTGSAPNNTSVGTGSTQENLTGHGLTATGNFALQKNTVSNSHTANGASALRNYVGVDPGNTANGASCFLQLLAGGGNFAGGAGLGETNLVYAHENVLTGHNIGNDTKAMFNNVISGSNATTGRDTARFVIGLGYAVDMPEDSTAYIGNPFFIKKVLLGGVPTGSSSNQLATLDSTENGWVIKKVPYVNVRDTTDVIFTSSSTSTVPLTLNGMAAQTANLQDWRVNGSLLTRVASDGGFYAPYLVSTGTAFVNAFANLNTGNNSAYSLTNNGSLITRNIADANSVLRIVQINASATGPLTTFENNGGVVVAQVTQTGGYEGTSISVSSTTKASSPWPKMTTTQRNALTPSEGDVVWDLTIHAPFYYDGSLWTQF